MKKCILFLAVMLSWTQYVNAQKLTEWSCSTVEPEQDFLSGQTGFQKSSLLTITDKHIQVHFHIIRRTNQTGGLTNANVNTVFSVLNNEFSGAQICFVEVGRTFINDNYYFNSFDESKFNDLINEDPNFEAIDIYLLPEGSGYGGRAASLPGKSLVVDGGLAQTPVVAHETGHCLGLYHTHSGLGCNDTVNCAENIHGSNCSTCGDRVCDTPADPCLANVVNSSCVYTGGGGYSPDVSNDMSYTLPECMDHFTAGQIDRMHTVMASSAVVQNTYAESHVSITGDFLVCTSNKTYTLHDRPSGTSVSWTKSSNLTYVSGQGTNNYVVKAASSSSGGQAWVRATISSGSCSYYVEKIVQSGPFNSGQIYVTGTTGVCPGNNYVYTVNVPGGHQSGFTYQWTKPTNWTINYQSANTISLYVPMYSPDYGTVRARVANGCGSYSGYSGVTVFPGYGCGSFYFSVFPNPASESLTVALVKVDDSADNEILKSIGKDTTTFAASLKTFAGKKVFGQRSTKGEVRLDVGSLPKGIYLVEILYHGEVVTERVVIE